MLLQFHSQTMSAVTAPDADCSDQLEMQERKGVSSLTIGRRTVLTRMGLLFRSKSKVKTAFNFASRQTSDTGIAEHQ